MPGCVRPARPARWAAWAWEMGVTMSDSMPLRGLYVFCLQKPVSITKQIPSIVSDVSAMFVPSTTLRAPGGVFSKILACCSDGSVA